MLNDLLNGIQGRIDIYLVGLFMGETGAGIYGMARQIRTPLRQVRQSFDGLLNPIIARTLAQKGAALTGLATASATRMILAIQLPLLLALLFGGEALLETFGPGFRRRLWRAAVPRRGRNNPGRFRDQRPDHPLPAPARAAAAPAEQHRRQRGGRPAADRAFRRDRCGHRGAVRRAGRRRGAASLAAQPFCRADRRLLPRRTTARRRGRGGGRAAGAQAYRASPRG